MMGYKSVRCEHLKQKGTEEDLIIRESEASEKNHNDLVIDLVDPICVISNANEILSKRLGKFVDEETRSYFTMIEKATLRTKTIVDELRSEKALSE
jgi:light-regulated signal transduction histidine kinase (bacteriophytochrome)